MDRQIQSRAVPRCKVGLRGDQIVDKSVGGGQIFRAQKLMFSLLAPAVITQPPCEPFINYALGGLSPETPSILDFI